jgi:hypothetical protein
MGKPKKSQTSTKEDLSKKKIEQLGKKVQYIGLLGTSFKCPNCKTTFKKGMVSEFKGIHYCSEDCVVSVATK